MSHFDTSKFRLNTSQNVQYLVKLRKAVASVFLLDLKWRPQGPCVNFVSTFICLS